MVPGPGGTNAIFFSVHTKGLFCNFLLFVECNACFGPIWTPAVCTYINKIRLLSQIQHFKECHSYPGLQRSECVGFNVPLDKQSVISETSLSRQSIAPVLTTKNNQTQHYNVHPEHQRRTQKPALANKTIKAVVW